MRKFLSLSLLLAAMTATAAEKQIDWSYAPSAGAVEFIGNGVAESHDIAVYINNGAVVGKQITGLEVAVPSDLEVTGATGWLASRLDTKVEKGIRYNDADICEYDATISDGVLSLTFAEPYTIPAEGVYVGYTLSISTKSDAASAKAPVAVVAGEEENGLWMRSSRKSRYWSNNSESLGYVSAMKVHIWGDFMSDSANFGTFEGLTMLSGKAGSILVPFYNAGDNEISSCEWSYQINGMSGVGAASFATPVPAVLGSKADVEVALPAIDECDKYATTLEVTTVNGVANNASTKSTTSNVKIIPFNPVCRPLLEEYTGTWCGYCTRGIAGMEEMNRRYGEDFVGVCIHSSDSMQVISSYPKGEVPSGLPGVTINRSYLSDPYYGDGSDEMDIDDLWQKFRKKDVNANVYVNAVWSDDSKQTMLIDASAAFIENLENANYRLACCMVADNLHSKSWKQTNYYNGESSDPDMPLYEWTQQGSSIADVTYNDVLVYMPDLDGVEGSVPSSIKAGEMYSHRFEYNVADAINVKSYWRNGVNEAGESTKVPIKLAEMAGVDNLRAVVMLINSDTNEVVNSVKTGYLSVSEDGVRTITSAEGSPVVETLWYDFTGRRITNPSAGLFIRVDVKADGSHVSSKQLLK